LWFREKANHYNLAVTLATVAAVPAAPEQLWAMLTRRIASRTISARGSTTLVVVRGMS
jgi:hypothetical protein